MGMEGGMLKSVVSLQASHDMIGLLLMIRINYQHRLIMSNRRVPALDGYLDRVNLALWPRFKVRPRASYTL